MNCRHETVEKSVPPGYRRGLDSVIEQYVAGSDTRGRPEGRSYPRSQQAIHEISGLSLTVHAGKEISPTEKIFRPAKILALEQ
jgi:hypothetical protein